jgi:MFS family permease
VIAGAAALQGMALIGFALSHWLPWSALAMAVTGFGTITMVAASQTILQTIVEDDKRARVMSLFTMAFLGFGPFGSLLGGKLADLPSVGPAKTVILGGLLCIVAAGAFSLYLPRFQRKVRCLLRRPVLVESSAPVDAG